MQLEGNIINNYNCYNISKLQSKKIKIDREEFELTKFNKEVLNKFIQIYNKVYTNIDVFKHILHSHVLYIVESNTNDYYLVTKKIGKFIIYDPKTVDNVENMYIIFKNLIEKLHSNNYIHGNINSESFMYNGDIFTLADCSKLIHVNNFLNQSCISGSKIISPLHIILEMIYSKVESDIIPINDFKSKFIKFYNIMSKKGDINVMKICQNHYSIENGVLDYVDYIINKFLIVKDGCIHKNPVKIKMYYYSIDWFSFGIVLHTYLHNIYLESSIMRKTPDNKLISFITDCLLYKIY